MNTDQQLSGNVARPEQTVADANDLALEMWAAMQIKSVRLRVIGRHRITEALDKMEPAERERAKHWLNHYQKLEKQQVGK